MGKGNLSVISVCFALSKAFMFQIKIHICDSCWKFKLEFRQALFMSKSWESWVFTELHIPYINVHDPNTSLEVWYIPMLTSKSRCYGRYKHFSTFGVYVALFWILAQKEKKGFRFSAMITGACSERAKCSWGTDCRRPNRKRFPNAVESPKSPFVSWEWCQMARRMVVHLFSLSQRFVASERYDASKHRQWGGENGKSFASLLVLFSTKAVSASQSCKSMSLAML